MRLQGSKGDWQEPEDTAAKESESENAETTDTDQEETLEKRAQAEKAKGPGARLRFAREAMNLTSEEVAARLRLTRQMIQDIDMDNFSLPTPRTFLRGYLRSYAKLVNISPDEIVAAFEKIPVQEQASNVQLPSPSTRQTWRKKESSISWMLYVSAALVLVATALAYQWWHSYNKLVPGDEPKTGQQTSPQQVQQSAQSSLPPLELTRTPSETPAATDVALEMKFSAPVTVKMVDREGKVLQEGKYDSNDHISYDTVAAYEILVDQPDNISVRYHGRLLMPVRYPGEEFARIILQ